MAMTEEERIKNRMKSVKKWRGNNPNKVRAASLKRRRRQDKIPGRRICADVVSRAGIRISKLSSEERKALSLSPWSYNFTIKELLQTVHPSTVVLEDSEYKDTILKFIDTIEELTSENRNAAYKMIKQLIIVRHIGLLTCEGDFKEIE